jgi:hypothetical protein
MQQIARNGKRFVLVPVSEWRRLAQLNAQMKRPRAASFPPYPRSDSQGNRPAVGFAQAAIAHKIITAVTPRITKITRETGKSNPDVAHL